MITLSIRVFLDPLVFLTGLSSPAVSHELLYHLKSEYSLGPAIVITSLTEPLVKFGGKVKRAAGEIGGVHCGQGDEQIKAAERSEVNKGNGVMKKDNRNTPED